MAQTYSNLLKLMRKQLKQSRHGGTREGNRSSRANKPAPTASKLQGTTGTARPGGQQAFLGHSSEQKLAAPAQHGYTHEMPPSWRQEGDRTFSRSSHGHGLLDSTLSTASGWLYSREQCYILKLPEPAWLPDHIADTNKKSTVLGGGRWQKACREAIGT